MDLSFGSSDVSVEEDMETSISELDLSDDEIENEQGVEFNEMKIDALGISEDVTNQVDVSGLNLDDDEEIEPSEAETKVLPMDSSGGEDEPSLSTAAKKKINEIDDYMNEQVSDENSRSITTKRVHHLGSLQEESRVQEVSQDLKQEHRSYVQSHDEELIRLGETIKSLREEKRILNDKLIDFENSKDVHQKGLNDLKAEIDEKNIELVVVKKRFEKQVDDLKFQLDLSHDKKEILLKKNEKLQQELETLSRDKKVDRSKIMARENELSEKLEMLRQDAEIQIKNRDQKILELKRRIDTLEFDVENSHLKHRTTIDNHLDLEDKMNRVIKTLRSAIVELEEEGEVQERREMMKKNLDV